MDSVVFADWPKTLNEVTSIVRGAIVAAIQRGDIIPNYFGSTARSIQGYRSPYNGLIAGAANLAPKRYLLVRNRCLIVTAF